MWRHTLIRLELLDRKLNFALRRALGVVLIALFLGGLCLMLYLWFRLMQPYPE